MHVTSTRTTRGRAPDRSPTPASSSPMRVAVVHGRDTGQFVSVPSTPGHKVTVGKGRENDLVLHDERVSAHHLEVWSSVEGVTLHDVGSAAGTFLGTTRLGDAIVAPGTRIRVGETILEIVAGPAASDLRARLAAEGLVFTGPAMTEVAESLARLAPFSTSVLIEGETGTGKEVIARAVHRLSMRANGPFVVVDCGAIPATLIESELFGHERGAFTGADRRRQGAFERAHGGTVFLDEIGELPLASQPALLGALQRRRFRRVGGHDEVEVDVRLVAATNRDLLVEVERGAFRADLYYRLATAGIWLPPLRRRLDDLPILIASLLTELTGSPAPSPFDEDAMTQLVAHAWPGNVRELRAVVERAVTLGRLDLGGPRGGLQASSSFLRSIEAPPSTPALPGGPPGAYGAARAEALLIFERDYLGRLIDACQGNASARRPDGPSAPPPAPAPPQPAMMRPRHFLRSIKNWRCEVSAAEVNHARSRHARGSLPGTRHLRSATLRDLEPQRRRRDVPRRPARGWVRAARLLATPASWRRRGVWMANGAGQPTAGGLRDGDGHLRFQPGGDGPAIGARGRGEASRPQALMMNLPWCQSPRASFNAWRSGDTNQ